MTDRKDCNEKKETYYTTTAERDRPTYTTHSVRETPNKGCERPTTHRYEPTSTSRYDTTTGRRYETTTPRYEALTERRSDSVIKGVIALLSFLALLWLAYGIISSMMHRPSYRTADDVMRRERVEESINSPRVETNKGPDMSTSAPVTQTTTSTVDSAPVTTRTATTTTEEVVR